MSSPTATPPELSGKVVLVTGAARGQGRAHCEAFAAAGCDVIAVDLCRDIETVPYPMADPEDLRATAEAVRALGRRCVTAEVDVRDLQGMRDAVEAGVAELGGLDFVVANAGVSPEPAASWERSEEEWDTTLDINLKGTWVTTTAAIPHILATGRGGCVVIISSMVGLRGAPFTSSYTTSKWAVRGLAKSLAGELGFSGVRCNSLHPGNVRTPMIENPSMIAMMTGGEGTTLEDAAETFSGMNQLPEPWVEASAISSMAVYLCSAAGAGITGASIPIDLGGSEKFGL
ncbi:MULTISPECIES: mycofactocin-coupled SDR family oxidoreductase [unclassified Dietzia]|uniref:mycofactocin-coupled SDR family oxidoreductase n=1 Tax=unclassified Dietzia TaxID=2617939 RepID=UPI0015FC6D23|nr:MULTISPECIES: mycofactocin-coupled SDR family oxidoreductase [unclassified Dietzia]MBB1024481.1 mycofactocin-coupled SDR family oxidoreductase [Dietzia sp. DQ12-76]MBB1028565.1 mycofactocin-coupled SDR family oxidoreductase [Dietzia sp. DQ11-38-2]